MQRIPSGCPNRLYIGSVAVEVAGVTRTDSLVAIGLVVSAVVVVAGLLLRKSAGIRGISAFIRPDTAVITRLLVLIRAAVMPRCKARNIC